MISVEYKTAEGNVYSFQQVLDYFDSLVEKTTQEVAMVYSPKKDITIYSAEIHETFTFNEIEA